MKHFRYLMLILCFIFTSSVFSQKIIKVKKPYVLIDISKNSGYQIGDEFLVYHPIADGEDKLVGVVELMVFKSDQCAAKIIKESITTEIQVGDIVTPYQKSGEEKVPYINDNETSSTSASIQSRFAFQRKSQLPSYLSFSAGMISFGISYFYYNEAEKNSTKYHLPDEHDQLVDETRKFDNISNFCLGLGGGLIAYSIINYMLTRRANIRMNERVSVVPVHKRDYYGMSLTFDLNYSK